MTTATARSAATTGCSSGTSCAAPRSPGSARRRSIRSSARAWSSTREKPLSRTGPWFPMRHTEPARAAPPADVLRTARSIAAAQRPDGAIGWPDGHVDPWDHVECAMALSACGLAGPARHAYRWLRDTQRPDGSWPRTTGGPGAAGPGDAADHAAESHHAAYVAVGVWHEFLITGDHSFAAAMWPAVRDAIGWVLDLQAPRG